MTALDALRDVVQADAAGRGLCTDPARNLVTAFPDDFRQACLSLADHPAPCLAVVTGFLIPTAEPVAGETDGPLGALFLARALVPLGIRVALVTDDSCIPALRAGLAACGLRERVALQVLPTPARAAGMTDAEYVRPLFVTAPTHLLAIERVGPSHTLESLQQQRGAGEALGETYLDFLAAVPAERQDRCHTMRGLDITGRMSPAHRLFEAARRHGATTIGIGDGGNEIGMGKVGWDVIHRNVPGGGLIACRVPADHLIVCGVSNWGAYALAAGVALRRGRPLDPRLFDPAVERRLLQVMVEQGPLVDGVLGRPSVTVDGLPWETYAAVLTRLGALVNP